MGGIYCREQQDRANDGGVQNSAIDGGVQGRNPRMSLSRIWHRRKEGRELGRLRLRCREGAFLGTYGRRTYGRACVCIYTRYRIIDAPCLRSFSVWVRSSAAATTVMIMGIRQLLATLAHRVSLLVRSLLLWTLSAGPIPSHIAIIMDGNRRFADRLRIARWIGHSHGYDALLKTLHDCFDLRVRVVSLYAFSIDNFQRPPEEVSALMDLMKTKLESLIDKEDLVRKHGVRVNVLGNLGLLPEDVRKAAEKVMDITRHNRPAVLNLFVAYSSTQEIVQAAQRIRSDCLSLMDQDVGPSSTGGTCADLRPRALSLAKINSINEEEVERHLYTESCIPPDLIIRTSGETRLSNFMLWQTSFSHLHFTNVLWPDFSFKDLLFIILEYQRAYPALLRKRQGCSKLTS